MGKIKDLSSQQFGKLTVVNYAYCKNRRAYWNCKCSYGWSVEKALTTPVKKIYI